MMRFRPKKICKYLVLVQTTIGIVYLVLYANINEEKGTETSLLPRSDPPIHTAIVLKNVTSKSRVTTRPTSIVRSVPIHHNLSTKTAGLYHVESVCSDVSTFPIHLAKDDTWATLDRNKSNLIYSAYHVQEGSSLTIIGARIRPPRRREKGKPYVRTRYTCQLWFQKDDRHVVMREETATVRDLPEHHGMNYTATFFHCPISSEFPPIFVSIVTRSCNKPTNLLRVRRSTQSASYGTTFTVCLTPLNSNYNKAYELVEWIELNKLLGADKFTIYNYSSAENVVQVLDYYTQLNLVDVVQWQIPLKLNAEKTDIHYYGQISALQDCLYRNKGLSDFIVNTDLDEFIIPRGDNVSTWSEMLQTLKTSASGYVFQNTFFKKEWDDTIDDFPDKRIALKYDLVTLLKTKHETRIFKHKNRSKYIARTADLDRLTIHDIPKVSGTGLTNAVYVPAGLAMLHHYRNWHQYDDHERFKVKDDIVVRKYASRLARNVDKVWKTLIAVETGL